MNSFYYIFNPYLVKFYDNPYLLIRSYLSPRPYSSKIKSFVYLFCLPRAHLVQFAVVQNAAVSKKGQCNLEVPNVTT